jgi:hypothetical protein
MQYGTRVFADLPAMSTPPLAGLLWKCLSPAVRKQ